MMMLEKNNLDVALLMANWLNDSVNKRILECVPIVQAARPELIEGCAPFK